MAPRLPSRSTPEPLPRALASPPAHGEIRKTVLPNGLTVLTEDVPHVRTVSIGLWLKEGSRNEAPAEHGLAHFIEHLVFKGTETRNAREIAILTDSIGGALDAFTSREYAAYYARVLDEHLDVAVDLLSDIILHPSFPPEEIERERKVIFEEIKMVEDSPDDLAWDLLYHRLWGDHPLGRTIQGTIEEVSAHTRDHITGFFRRNYVSSNLILCAAGNLRHDRLVEMAAARFSALRPDGHRIDCAHPEAGTGIVHRAKADLEQVHLLVGFPGYPAAHPTRYAFSVLANLLGGGMSSRLFQKIREERGLAYSVFAAGSGYRDAGNFAVYLATSPEAVPEAIRLVGEELRSLRDGPVPEEEMRRSKENLKGGMMLGLESTSNRMSNLARQEIYHGRQYTLDEIVAEIEAVTPGQMLDCARHVFDPARTCCVVVGPHGVPEVTAGMLGF